MEENEELFFSHETNAKIRSTIKMLHEDTVDLTAVPVKKLEDMTAALKEARDLLEEGGVNIAEYKYANLTRRMREWIMKYRLEP